MKYGYTNESEVPINMTVTYRELTLLEKLLDAKTDDWRYDEMRTVVKETVREVVNTMSTHYQYEQYSFEKKETDDA